jgi:hypothetical protein
VDAAWDFSSTEEVDPEVEGLQAFLAIAEVEAARPRETTLDAFRTRYEDDFLGFCSLLEIKPKDATAGGRIPFRLTEIQAAYNEARTPRDVILKPRQVKITTIELARDLWYFLTKQGVGVRVICQSSTDHSMLNELSERLSVFFDALRSNAGLDIDFKSETRSSFVLHNGSSLQIVEAGASEKAAQKKVRGETVHRIHTTEIAFWEYAGQTLNAMLESIAGPEAGTEIVHESTANGAGGDEAPKDMKNVAGGAYFYWLCQNAKKGSSGYTLHFFSWLREPEYRIELAEGEVVSPEDQGDSQKRERERAIVALGATPAQLKWYRNKVANKGQGDTDQEYASDPRTCFLVSGRGFFDRTKVDGLMARARPPLRTVEIARPGAIGTLKVWEEPEAGAVYIVAADTSEGTGGDSGAAKVWRTGRFPRHVATLWGQFKPGELAKESFNLGVSYNGAIIAVERNNHGHAFLFALALLVEAAEPAGCPFIYIDQDKKPGWLTSQVSRTADADVLGEFRTFIVSKSGKPQAAGGAHDDLVITAAIAWDLLGKIVERVEHGVVELEDSGYRMGGRGW